MPIEASLKSAIGALVDGGCYNGVNTSTTITLPYVVFYEISGEPTLGISGDLGLTRSRYQIDIFAASPEQAKGLALGSIKSAVEELEGALMFQMAGQYSDLDKTFQYITEYQIWIPSTYGFPYELSLRLA